MSKQNQSRPRRKAQRRGGRGGALKPAAFGRLHARARRLAEQDSAQAREIYRRLEKGATDARSKALIANDLAVIAAVKGDIDTARERFHAALELDRECEPARLNLAFLEADYPAGDPAEAADVRSALSAQRRSRLPS